MRNLFPVCFITFAMALGASAPAQRAEAAGHSTVIDQWYSALQNADAAALDALLTEDATIMLKDLDISQTRAEFLESMDEWKDAIAGGELRHETISDEGETIIVKACYDFPDNDILMQETFTLNNNKIILQMQEQLGDSCS